METMVPGRLPHRALWTAALLLCLGTRALEGISRRNLHTIISYVTRYGVPEQYAFAVSLNKTYCDNPAGLEQGLPREELRRMREAINQRNGLYDPTEGHVVAARVNRLGPVGQHTEWRLLQGHRNSPVRKLLARTYRSSSCLIFFTLSSPCTRTCLLENGRFNILRMVSDTFSRVGKDYKAFVFQQIYREDQNLAPRTLLRAWHRLRRVPLYRCDNNGCRNCHGTDPNTNHCLPRRRGVGREEERGDRGEGREEMRGGRGEGREETGESRGEEREETGESRGEQGAPLGG